MARRTIWITVQVATSVFSKAINKALLSLLRSIETDSYFLLIHLSMIYISLKKPPTMLLCNCI